MMRYGPQIETDVPESVQESSFMNATLQSAGQFAVSIAVHLPDHANDFDSQASIAAMLHQDFKHLTDIGYAVEIQIGEAR